MTREEAIEFIKGAHFGYLATIGTDGRPRVRPVGIHTVYGNDLYFFTFSNTRKCGELAATPYVEVVWTDAKSLSQVRIRGLCSVVEDPAVKQRFKEDEPFVNKILPPGAEHLFCLYRIEPEIVEAAEGLVPYQQVAW